MRIMSDRTEEEEDRYLRRVGRRMKIHPEGLLEQLRPLGFILLHAARDFGSNELAYLRPAPSVSGLFDILKLKSDVRGSELSIDVTQAIVSHPTPCVSVRSWISATRLGYDRNTAKIGAVAQAIEVERRLVQAVPELFAECFERHGRALFESTATAREAAERYLVTLQPSADLQETLQRIRAAATETQWQQALEYIRRDSIRPLNLVDFRPLWEIAGLCQVHYWERPAPFRGIGGGVIWSRANDDDREAHWRFHLVASRLARAPGWPVIDPLVPNRSDLEETIPWRDQKPPYVAQVFDRYLATIDRRCACGKCLYYVRHTVLDQEPRTAAVLARCNNGHEETIELAAAGLGTLS